MKKIKEFYQKHKEEIWITVGVIGVSALGLTVACKLDKKTWNYLRNKNKEPFTKPYVNPYKDILEDVGAIFKEGYDVPFADKETVDKFLIELGGSYQIDILDEDTSVVYINTVMNKQ